MDDHELRHKLLPWVQRHLIRNYQDQHVVSHSEAVEQLVAIIRERPVPRFFDLVAGELRPTVDGPCGRFVGDGRSEICLTCDWPESEHRHINAAEGSNVRVGGKLNQTER